ncbi:MAG: sugar ABC transporter permease [Erysipelotrichia bacterium]|jgi:arabinogalactan oligomer/maltooligosaccharide transport system permease protein|nr:sugar ABC transporter permease [Erysipelotrichia bacterium]
MANSKRLSSKLLTFLSTPFRVVKEVLIDIKKHPDALKSAILSMIFMGAGQFRNKQKVKGSIFLGIFLFVLLVEVFTGGYFFALDEMARFPADQGGTIYFIRDYGGFFSYGLWGLFTLGQVVGQSIYRGQFVETFNRNIPWLSADNSVTLLGRGLIVLVISLVVLGFYIYNIVDAYNTRKEINAGAEVETGVKYFKRLWTDMFPFIILVPSLVMIMFFTLVPFLFSFLLAFTNYTYRLQIPNVLIRWVGFDTFKLIVGDPGWLRMFLSVLSWTFLYAIMSSFTVYVLGLIQAIIIESKFVKGKKFWRTILIMPWAIPAMISLMVFKNVFDTNGLANQLLYATGSMQSVSTFLYSIGLQGRLDNPIFWLTANYNGNLAKFVVLAVNLWLGSPYFMMLITGVLTTLPKDLYEAAAIDGATRFQQFKRITLPLILRATLPAIVMTFTFNFNNFGAIYFLTGGGPAFARDAIPQSMRIMGGVPGQTDILISWIYNLSFASNAQLYNIASVYSILIFLFIGSISVFNLARSKNLWEED